VSGYTAGRPGDWDEAERRRLETPPSVVALLDGLADTARAAGSEMLRVHGYCPPPTVHIVCADMDQPYAAMLTCRPFYRGRDAAEAVASMGALPSALMATHLVVTWEHADMCTALQLAGEFPDGTFPCALVVLEATLSEHTVRRYPFDIAAWGPTSSAGMPTVLPRWSEPTQERGGWVPEPFERLLAGWREWTEHDQLQPIAVGLQRAGYRISWAARS